MSLGCTLQMDSALLGLDARLAPKPARAREVNHFPPQNGLWTWLMMWGEGFGNDEENPFKLLRSGRLESIDWSSFGNTPHYFLWLRGELEKAKQWARGRRYAAIHTTSCSTHSLTHTLTQLACFIGMDAFFIFSILPINIEHENTSAIHLKRLKIRIRISINLLNINWGLEKKRVTEMWKKKLSNVPKKCYGGTRSVFKQFDETIFRKIEKETFFALKSGDARRENPGFNHTTSLTGNTERSEIFKKKFFTCVLRKTATETWWTDRIKQDDNQTHKFNTTTRDISGSTVV